MSVNCYKPHILVLPEDDANRQLANGFLLEMPDQWRRQVQILPVARGWAKVIDEFRSQHVDGMFKYPSRTMVLAIDFDGQSGRLCEVRSRIPQELADRVFVLGVWTRPEDLKRLGLGSYEEIGQQMCRGCRSDFGSIWSHELLKHNGDEILRLLRAPVGTLFK